MYRNKKGQFSQENDLVRDVLRSMITFSMWAYAKVAKTLKVWYQINKNIITEKSIRITENGYTIGYLPCELGKRRTWYYRAVQIFGVGTLLLAIFLAI